MVDGLTIGVELNEVGLNKEEYSAEGMISCSTEMAFERILYYCLTQIKEMSQRGGQERHFVPTIDLPNDMELLNKLAYRLREDGFKVIFGNLVGREVMKVEWANKQV